MPKMIESMAQAMCEDNGSRWASAFDNTRNMWRRAAIAGLKAAREPTASMTHEAMMVEIASAYTADMGNGTQEPVTFPLGVALMDTGCREVKACLADLWRNMIDTATREPSGRHWPDCPLSNAAKSRDGCTCDRDAPEQMPEC